jgi:CheY-like chemotaxis protein
MKRALIVEDEKGIQEILEELLISECGFDVVDKANDGLEGFHMAMLNQYDVITLDQMMPYCHGTELLVALRHKVGFNSHTPILFISAYIPQIPEELKQAENTFYLDKPIDFTRFNRYVKMSVKK